MENEKMNCELVSIDAWRDMEGWIWNQSYSLRKNIELPQSIKTRALLKWLRDEGFLSEESKGRVRVEEIGDSIIEIQRKSDYMPLYAFIIDYA